MDKEMLDKIEEYASLFFTVDEIALILEVDAIKFRRDVRHGNNDIGKAYYRGKLKTMVEIRRLTVEFAKKGSPQAEAFVRDYIEKQEENE